MSKVIAPNKDYDGISAGVTFVKGVGECTDSYLLDWFKVKGYIVEGDSESDGKGENSEFNNMTVDELKAYAEANGIDIGKSTSQNSILKKILEAKAE
jgi:hypothetical protein